ncbi:zinc-binding alcohol dehydrogenase family protein [Tahibacter amnicola]|uniref:Zinc-type alcohol dehydrogenase-like protein n=1 Tax=Tahibacter amnicola TaxID=2976241 RepID=A0ABY6BKW9_9GAMM|nr:zinc-binding alcohol dehydrogenase family protein [Tahibacter amnicola]UXI70063.1 zinc-binding alcohol dehydrogenase family protein [Tahibacter amnicola]
MRAVGLNRYLPITEPDSLVDLELPVPQPTGTDLLVRVQAISVNPVDVKVRAPKALVEPAPRVLGWDAAGVVEAVGDSVTLFRPGDAVYYAGDITRPGCNAQFHLVDQHIVAAMPRSLDFAHAAALPLTAITAWELLFDRFGIDPDGFHSGRSLLILGGAGGLGSMVIQLARLAGLRVIATASRPESADWCRSLGAEAVLDHGMPLRPQLESLGLAHVDYIANLVDVVAYWEVMADLIAPQGCIGLVSEPSGPVRLGGPLKEKSVSLHWEFMFTRPMFSTADRLEQHRLLTRIAALVDAGTVRGTARQVLTPINARQLREAHARIESGRTVGKIVLEGW